MMKAKTLLIILCMYTGILTTNSQDSIPKIKKYWLDTGIGITAKIENQNYLAMSLSLNYMHNKSIYKLRFLGAGDFKLFGQSEGTASIGALLGKRYSSKFTQITFYGGIGVSFSKKLTDKVIGTRGSGWFSYSMYETKNNTSISIPLEIEILATPYNFYGVGISLFAEIGTRKPIFGLMFKSAFGRLRK